MNIGVSAFLTSEPLECYLIFTNFMTFLSISNKYVPLLNAEISNIEL